MQARPGYFYPSWSSQKIKYTSCELTNEAGLFSSNPSAKDHCDSKEFGQDKTQRMSKHCLPEGSLKTYVNCRC